MGTQRMLIFAVANALLVANMAWAQQGQPEAQRVPVTEITEKNFVKIVQNTPFTLVVFFSGNPKETEYENYLMQQMEMASGYLLQSGIKGKIASVQASKSPNLIKQLGIQPEARPIMLFRANSMPQEYFGQRTGESFVRYLTEIHSGNPVKMISTKAEKKKFEEFEFAKVIAYVEPKSAMEKWYKQAGEHFLPLVPFYQVTDKKIAKSLRLKKPGVGYFVKPYEKQISIPSNVTNDRSMIQFIYANRKQSLLQVRMLEIHLTWSGVMSPNLFMAILKPGSHAGSRFLSTLKSVAKHFGKNQSLHLAWADSESDVQMMLPQWSKTFDHDFASSAVSFGFIDMAKNKHAWLDLEEEGSLTNSKRVTTWIDDALSGRVELAAASNSQAAPKAESEEDFDIPAEGEEEEENVKTEL